MELVHITNPVGISEMPEVGIKAMPTKNDALGLASQLPFLKRNYLQYTTGVAYDFGNGKDLHYTIMVSKNFSNKIRIYTNISGYGTVCLESSSPDGPWELKMDGDNPLKIVELTQDLIDAGYTSINLASIVWNAKNHAVDGYYRGWCTLGSGASYVTAFCKSQNGLEWIDYTICDYDATIKAKLGSYRFIMGAYYDEVSRKYFAIASGLQSESVSGRPVFITSTDGVNWTFVGELPWFNNSFTNNEYHACCMTKIGELFLAGISRYDYTEGRQVKNPVWCYSADNGATWNTWNYPFLALRDQYFKYPGIYCTPNYIYLPYIYNGRYLCMAKMEWSENPPVTTNVSDISTKDVASAGFYCKQEGAKKAVVTISCTSSVAANVEFDVYPFVALGTRLDAADWKGGASCKKVELELEQGANVISFEIDNLPHLWNFSLTSKTAGCTISDIYVEYVKY